MQDDNRLSSEAIRNVLDCAGCQCHSRAARQPPQRSLRTILGKPVNGGLTTTTMSRTLVEGGGGSEHVSHLCWVTAPFLRFSQLLQNTVAVNQESLHVSPQE